MSYGGSNHAGGAAGFNWPLFCTVLGVLALFGVVGIVGARVLIQQSASDARHRMAAIEREMEALRIEKETIESHKAALLTREALRRRLAEANTGLQEIEPGTVLVIGAEPAEETGVAMGGAAP